MKLPHSFLLPCNQVLFTARGGKIHSFNLKDGSYLSTWKHPDVDKLAAAQKAGPLQTQSVDNASSASITEDGQGSLPNDEPPAKRQKVESGQENEDVKSDNAMDVDEPENGAQVESGEKKDKNASKNRKAKQDEKKGRQAGLPQRSNYAKAPEQPLITYLVSTTNGSHVVAISGHDKTIWVFKHDGEGALKQLSQRVMPKRPCTVLVTPDDATIISADKFGDVYSLPLVPSPTETDVVSGGTPSSARSTPAATVSKPWKPEASNLTVHSRRNLDALKQQEIQAAKAAQEKEQQGDKPTFEHNLIIGHVSLLTAMILAQKGPKRYILTADRDEHIRLSRFIPQAYIIEGFCLGHKNFVNAMNIPSGRPELLISGGGDDDLHVWDWETGKLLSKFDLLSRVRGVDETTTKLAVTRISSAKIPGVNGGQTTVVFVLCEGVPAVFVAHIPESENELAAPEAIPLTGNALHLAQVTNDDGSLGRILIATDAGDSGTEVAGVQAFEYTSGTFQRNTAYEMQDGAVASDDEPELSLEAIRKLLFNAEDLRKVSTDAQEAQEDDPDASVAQD